jgi:hypothetical protein
LGDLNVIVKGEVDVDAEGGKGSLVAKIRKWAQQDMVV